MSTVPAPTSAPVSDEEMPLVTIETAPRHLLGFPFLVALTYENKSKETEFYALPKGDLLASRVDITLRLEPKAGGAPFVTRFAKPEEPHGLTLLPGHALRVLFDLSNTGSKLPLGAHRLTMTLVSGKERRESNAVDVDIVAPSGADEAEATRLRKMGGARLDTGAWRPFLADNWATVTPSPSLSAEAKGALALHLFLHRVAYGPEPLSKADVASLAAITDASLQGEVAALRYELLSARHDPGAAAARAALQKAYPGLVWRCDAVDRGEGALLILRRSVGAEKTHLRAPPNKPYVP